MYNLSLFCRLLHYVLGRAVDTYDFTTVFGSWRHLRLLCPLSQELRNVPDFLALYSVSLRPEFFFAQNKDILIFVRSAPLRCELLKKIDINVKRGIVMSNWLTFSWFVDTCNLRHQGRGPGGPLEYS
jgi:hypothetical protein